MRKIYSIERTSNSKIINFSKQLTVLGQLLMFEAVFMVIPLIVCISLREKDWLPFLCTIGVTALTGIILKFAINPKSDNLGRKDGAMITCIVWI